MFKRVPQWRLLRAPLAISGALAALLLLAGAWGYRVNFSESEPVGLWRVSAPAAALHPHDYVVFCAAIPAYPFLERGYCPNGTMAFLKSVAAVPGDRIEVNQRGVWVNGERLPHSEPLANLPPDVRGQLDSGPGILPQGQYWVEGRGWPQHSFDSRYWGPVSATQIQFIARPVLVWYSHH